VGRLIPYIVVLHTSKYLVTKQLGPNCLSWLVSACATRVGGSAHATDGDLAEVHALAGGEPPALDRQLAVLHLDRPRRSREAITLSGRSACDREPAILYLLNLVP
jgi:hypothetical protein